jgi:hypothetical protein
VLQAVKSLLESGVLRDRLRAKREALARQHKYSITLLAALPCFGFI